MTLPNYDTDFITNEMWVANSSGTRWVEVGIAIGIKPGGYVTTPHRFWAEQKAAGYFEHYYEMYTFDNYLTVTARATAQGSNDWEVWYGTNGTRYTSADNLTSPAKRLDTGTEVTTSSAHSYGSTSDMRWYDLDAGLHDGWQGSNSGAQEDADSGMTATWVDEPNWIRTGRGAAC